MALTSAEKVTLALSVNLNAIVITRVNVIKSLENASMKSCVPMDGAEAIASKVRMLSMFIGVKHFLYVYSLICISPIHCLGFNFLDSFINKISRRIRG